MKYAAVLLLVGAAFAAPAVDEQNIQSAQFMGMNPMMGMGMNPMMGGMGMNPMMMDPMYGMMMGMNPMMGMGHPGMGMGGMGPMYYGSKREDYPIDYNQGCSSSCGCAQRCQVTFWMPCSCMCPPPCPPPPPPPCCNPCVGWICNPCNNPCENDPPPQDPDVPEWPFPRPEDEKVQDDKLRFPILNNLRDRLVETGILPERKPEKSDYPADIIIRWRD